MNTKSIIAVALLVTISAVARIIVPFESWSQVEAQSPFIFVAHCGERTPDNPSIIVINSTRSDSAIEIVCLLRGTNSPSPARLLTDHKLQKGENYLVFARYENFAFKAYEEYRVIPLGKTFQTNSIAGKSLDEQMQILFKRRLDELDKQMKEELAEKQRLEMILHK